MEKFCAPREVFERTMFQAAKTIGVQVDMSEVKINGEFAYYLNPTVQHYWECNGGVSPAKGKDY